MKKWKQGLRSWLKEHFTENHQETVVRWVDRKAPLDLGIWFVRLFFRVIELALAVMITLPLIIRIAAVLEGELAISQTYSGLGFSWHATMFAYFLLQSFRRHFVWSLSQSSALARVNELRKERPDLFVLGHPYGRYAYALEPIGDEILVLNVDTTGFWGDEVIAKIKRPPPATSPA